MKSVNLIRPLLGLLFLVIMMSGCQNDELSSSGTLKVVISNNSGDLHVGISPAENTTILIKDMLIPNKKGVLTYKLNVGNYILVGSSPTYFPAIGFQIKAGKTTEIKFDTVEEGHVQ